MLTNWIALWAIKHVALFFEQEIKLFIEEVRRLMLERYELHKGVKTEENTKEIWKHPKNLEKSAKSLEGEHHDKTWNLEQREKHYGYTHLTSYGYHSLKDFSFLSNWNIECTGGHFLLVVFVTVYSLPLLGGVTIIGIYFVITTSPKALLPELWEVVISSPPLGFPNLFVK